MSNKLFELVPISAEMDNGEYNVSYEGLKSFRLMDHRNGHWYVNGYPQKAPTHYLRPVTPPGTVSGEGKVAQLWDAAVDYCNKSCKGGDHSYSSSHAAFLAGAQYREQQPLPVKGEGYQKQYADALEWIAMFYGALHELVQLKDLKDKEGKTDEYEERQPKAWYLARQSIELWAKSGYGALPITGTGYSAQQMKDCWNASWSWHYGNAYGKVPNPRPDFDTFISSLAGGMGKQEMEDQAAMWNDIAVNIDGNANWLKYVMETYSLIPKTHQP
jgi:hypothetical protein